MKRRNRLALLKVIKTILATLGVAVAFILSLCCESFYDIVAKGMLGMYAKPLMCIVIGLTVALNAVIIYDKMVTTPRRRKRRKQLYILAKVHKDSVAHGDYDY